MTLISLLEQALFYGLTGVFSGLISGILGIGGGVIVVPALVFIFSLTSTVPPSIQMQVAAASSLAIMIFTAQASVQAHQRQEKIEWGIFKRMWPLLVIGTLSGAFLATILPTRLLEMIFGIFLLAIAISMLYNVNIEYAKKYPPLWVHWLVCYVIGFKSGLLGIGGGALIIPYLSYCGVDTRRIPAVSALCTLVVAIIGTIAVIITGSFIPRFSLYATGYVYWPAVIWVAIFSMIFASIGARITYALPVKQLKYSFIVVLLVAAINLLI